MKATELIPAGGNQASHNRLDLGPEGLGRGVRHVPLNVLPLVIFPLLLLWRTLFAGESFFWGTPLLQFVPWQQMAADMWRSGHLPLWNPLVGCGAPLAANYQTAAFYPLNALYLVLQAEVALSWTVALHLALAGWGMVRLGRVMGLERFPALVGALALEGSGFLVARAALFPSIVLTFAWIPVWLWRAEVLVRAVFHGRAQGLAGLRDALWLGLAVGLGLLAGHAQTVVYGGLLLTAFLLFRAAQEASRPFEAMKRSSARALFRVFALALVSLTVGLGLAAVQILPTAELLVHSQRAHGADYDFAMTYSFWPWRLITFAAPDFFGNPGRGDYWGYATYWEDAGYLGLLPLLLAIGALTAAAGTRLASSGTEPPIYNARMKPLTGFWAGSAAVGVVLALGKNAAIYPFLARQIPGFPLFHAPARWLAVTTVATSVLAAVGAQRWLRGGARRRRGALASAVGGALLIGALIAPRVASSVRPTFGPATARLGGLLLLVGALDRLRRWDVWWQAAVLSLILIDLLTVGWSLVPSIDRDLYRGETETAAVLRREGDPIRVYWPMDPEHRRWAGDAHYRVKFDYLTFNGFGPDDADYWAGMREAQLPNSGMLDGVASASNFDPLLVGRYADVLEAALEAPHVLRAMGVTHVASDQPWPGAEPVHSSGSVSFSRLPGTPGRAWVVPSAFGVALGEALTMLVAPGFDPAAAVLLEAESGGARGSTDGELSSAKVALRDGPNRATIHVAVNAPGYLVLADTWYPGWHVTVDGEPDEVLRANHAFRAVRLDAGTHMVEMAYRPWSAIHGLWISLGTLAMLVLGCIAGERIVRPGRMERLAGETSEDLGR
jgi:hypothetical protein